MVSNALPIVNVFLVPNNQRGQQMTAAARYNCTPALARRV